ncbi:hypothetical protein ASE01_01005 [Nocardioides sp. Root190]|uniref:enoyl-CoA hydratase/isomerase family protein n=1 Tax=Nocardioides sp. Root190 TaxID=1736488 RepID=UPI0006FC617F|nr:enoyl-CoA hydratase-related protein [Nocardioides sp. Root190]KRB80113.1 hypothetical protein ASE01_01005 [Nocardioides sp. Root190]
MTASIRMAVRRGIATIDIDASEGRPSLDSAARAQLLLSLRQVGDDPAISAVVLRGSGQDFCEGRDLDEGAARLSRDPVIGVRELELQTAQVVHMLATVHKPVIAAVRGRCTGEGLALALACDLRVLADDAVLSTTSCELGEHPDRNLRAALTRWVGVDRARELTLGGRRFTAREALEWGLVADVVPSSHVVDVALGQAAMLARLPADQLDAAKIMLAGAAALELEQALCAASATS